ncbi:pilus assembly protein [Thalassobaculum fulvum]|uniref:Pilus assembly protein n=1 Tax=Thalassobaculum fulvum TaxID=1633335 RepID=A0A919CQL7_9PROT|nr:DUF1028 domain-containing protein [Thalassobaculum fulvum]GHD54838.1 pilus assembly protein [Thalassobaculum fulvum]
MTFSIVARDAATGALGIAIASRVIAVGALCPWIRPGVAAVSTQSYTSPVAAERTLAHLSAGQPFDAAVAQALGDDDGRVWRQVHGVDAAGRPYAYTGTSCVTWCGHWTGDGVSVAGNMLSGPAVVDAAAEAWLGGQGRRFADRLLTALEAGQAVGGDKRGQQSAALKVVGDEAHAEVDLRVDEHAEPIAELRRVFELFWTERRPYLATLPTRRNPSGIYEPEAREAFIARFRAADATPG